MNNGRFSSSGRSGRRPWSSSSTGPRPEDPLPPDFATGTDGTFVERSWGVSR